MDAIAGMRVLLAGDDDVAVSELRAAISLAGAVPAACSGDPADVAAVVASDPPAAVLAVGADPVALRARLDPLGLESGPEVVPVEDLTRSGSPFDAAASRRLRALIDRRSLRARQVELEAVIATQAVGRRRELQEASVDMLRRLAAAAEYRDDNTHEHTQRVGDVAARLARLTDEEFEVVKTHAVLGARVLAGGESDLLQTAERVARTHHERWDGTGYPDGLAGHAIPIEGRLVHVADVFDVLVHERPYKESWTVEAATEEIRRGAGTQFDPDVVAAFDGLGASAWELLDAQGAP
jgi:HD-GYP domain-containing protein (c-di-GMP phosphodiesterase class II)